MFENLFNKKISTKNLFIASLKTCVAKEFILGRTILDDSYLCKFQLFKYFVFVRKIKKDYHYCYQDIFTKTIYEYEPSGFEVGNFYINSLVPFPVTTSYIRYKDAVEAYNKLNNISSNQDSEIKTEIEVNFNKTLQKRKKH